MPWLQPCEKRRGMLIPDCVKKSLTLAPQATPMVFALAFQMTIWALLHDSLLGSNLRRFFQEGSGRCISYLVLPPHCGRRLSYEFLGALNAVRLQSVSLGWNLHLQLYYDFPGARFECLQRLDLQCDSLPEIGML